MADQTSLDISKYRGLLAKSPSAYDPGVSPTQQDVALHKKLLAAESNQARQESIALGERWYGQDDDAGVAPGKEAQGKGVIGKALQVLATPLYATVGAAEALLGKGTKKGFANIGANIKEEGTWGDLLRNYNMPNIAAMPLGFIMDLALDPLNIIAAPLKATTIGRTALGAVRAGKLGKNVAEGALLGAKSGALTKLEGASRLVPGFRKVGEGVEDTAPDFIKRLAKTADQSRQQYDAFIERGIAEELALAGSRRKGFLSDAGNKIRDLPGGETLNKLFNYKPENAFLESAGKLNQAEKMGDVLSNLGRSSADDVLAQNKVNLPTGFFDKELNDVDNVLMGKTKSPATGYEQVVALEAEIARKKALGKRIDESFQKLMTKAKDGGDDQFLRQIEGLNADQAARERFGNMYEFFKTDVDAYDKVLAKALASPKGQKILGTYATVIGLFKTAKIGGNLPAATVNGLMGNLTFTNQIGINVTNPGFTRELKNALSIVGGKDVRAIQHFLNEPEIAAVWRQSPDLFEQIMGINPTLAQHNVEYFEKIAERVGKAAKQNGLDLDGMAEVRQAYYQSVDLTKAKAVGKETAARFRRGVSPLNSVERGQPTSFVLGEMFTGPYGEFIRKVKTLADQGKPGAKLFHWYLTKPSELYNKVDQTYRVGLMNHLWKNGISEKEVLKIAQQVDLPADALVKVSNADRYKIKPYHGMRIANEVYMNYMQMPAFVKMMRTLPLVGSPFMSFTFGAMAKTGKTAIYNPAFFNKVNFLMQEVTGNKSPVEKEALNSKYYSYLNKDGVVKLPFFKDNPVYLNAANWLPHYSFNFFTPNERTYNERFGGTVSKIIDKSPFLKDPIGQVWFDYMIQPMILNEDNPVGVFNQPLWPTDASGLEKAGYTARALAETVTPPVAGFLGLAGPRNNTAIEALPSFRWRQLANAVQGKTSVGVKGREPAASRTLRTLSGMAGMPTYRVDLTNQSKKK